MTFVKWNLHTELASGEEVFKPHIKKNLTPGADKGMLVRLKG